jgi:hypothetical protein
MKKMKITTTIKSIIITGFFLTSNILLAESFSASNSIINDSRLSAKSPAWDYARSGGWGIFYPSKNQAISCIAEFIKIAYDESEKVTLSCLGKPLNPHAQNLDVKFSYSMPCLTPEGGYGPPGTCNWPNFFGGTIYIDQKTKKLKFKASTP